MVTFSAKSAVVFGLSPGNVHDASEGQKLLVNLKGEGISFLINPVEDTWSTAKGIPTNREYFSVAVVDDIFYVIGGY